MYERIDIFICVSYSMLIGPQIIGGRTQCSYLNMAVFAIRNTSSEE